MLFFPESKYKNIALLVDVDTNIKISKCRKFLNYSFFYTRYSGHTYPIQAINFNLFRNLIVSGGSDNVIIAWDSREKKPVNCMMAHSMDITSLSFSLDSNLILSSGQDGFTRIWSLHTGLCKKTLLQDTTAIPSFSHFSSNSKFVLQSTLSN